MYLAQYLHTLPHVPGLLSSAWLMLNVTIAFFVVVVVPIKRHIHDALCGQFQSPPAPSAHAFEHSLAGVSSKSIEIDFLK